MEMTYLCEVLLLLSLGVVGTFSSSGQTPRIALVIIDVQNCFIAGGTLAVNEGEQVIPVIRQIRADYQEHFDLVVLSQDWHCSDHVSFYTQHNGSQPYDVITLHYTHNGSLCRDEGLTASSLVDCDGDSTPVQQSLWPPHCIINTTDADLYSTMLMEDTDIIVRKGYNCQVDSYSAFYDNGGFGQTEFQSILQEHNIDTLYITGLARDYCVYYTAKDSLTLGYTTYVIEDATRPVAPNTGRAAIKDMKSRGVHVIQSSELETLLVSSGTAIPLTKPGFWAAVVLSVLLIH